MVSSVPGGHAVPEGDVVQSDVGVDVGTEAANAFLAEGQEAEGCSFGAVGEMPRCFMAGPFP